MPDNDPYLGDRKNLARRFPTQRRRELFIAWYLVYGDGYQAALEAGWPESNAKQRASELLRDPDILAAIRSAQGERAKRINLTADRVLREAAYVALSNIDNYQLDETGNIVPKDDVSPAVMRAVKSIKYRTEHRRTRGRNNESDEEIEIRTAEITLWSKPDVLRLTFQHLGMIKTQVELTGKDGTPLIPLEAARRAFADATIRNIDETPIEIDVIPEDRRLAASSRAGEDVTGVVFDGDDLVYKGIRARLATEDSGETFTLTMSHPDAPGDVRTIAVSKSDAQTRGIAEIDDLLDLYGAAS